MTVFDSLILAITGSNKKHAPIYPLHLVTQKLSGSLIVYSKRKRASFDKVLHFRAGSVVIFKNKPP